MTMSTDLDLDAIHGWLELHRADRSTFCYDQLTLAVAEVSALRAQLAVQQEQVERLTKALIGLVGASTREELESMEAFLRVTPAPAEDKAASIDAIHALLAALSPASQEMP